MYELLALPVILFGLWSANVVSRYSLAVFIDPDEVETLFPQLSKFQQRFLARLADDPRAFTQMATIYSSFVLVGISGLALPPLVLLTTLLGWHLAAILVPGLLLIWLAYVIFAEYLPRRSSRSAIGHNSIRHLWLLVIIYYLFSPILRLYRLAIEKLPSGAAVSEEEKEEIVERAIETLADDAGIGESLVEDDEKEMIGQIFQLDQTVVKEIMIPRPDITGVEQSMSFAEIREIVLKSGYSRFPVYEQTIDKVVGLMYVKDLFNRMPAPGESFNISRYLRKPYFVPQTKIIGELLTEFKVRRQHIAMVVDEYGGTAGLVTLEDIIEEIFGEIVDEHDTQVAEIIELKPNLFRVSAALQVEKLQDHLDTDFEQGDDYDTVGGLIYDLVGAVPQEGQRIKWHTYEFEIVSVEGQRIRTVKVRKLRD